MIWRCRWGVQPPLVGGDPTRAILWPRVTRWPTSSPSRESSVRWPYSVKKRVPLVGLVSQDHQGAVVLRGGVVGEGVDHALERGAEGGARPHEEIDAEVYRAPLVGGALSGTEEPREVDPPGLVVAPDAHRDARLLHLTEDLLGQRVGPGLLRVRTEEEAAHSQVEDQTGRGAQVDVEYRSHRGALGREPGASAPRPRRGGPGAGRRTPGRCSGPASGGSLPRPSSASQAGASLIVTYGSSGFSRLIRAEFVTLTASRAPMSGNRSAISSSWSGAARWYPATTRAAAPSGSLFPMTA